VWRNDKHSEMTANDWYQWLAMTGEGDWQAEETNSSKLRLIGINSGENSST